MFTTNNKGFKIKGGLHQIGFKPVQQEQEGEEKKGESLEVRLTKEYGPIASEVLGDMPIDYIKELSQDVLDMEVGIRAKIIEHMLRINKPKPNRYSPCFSYAVSSSQFHSKVASVWKSAPLKLFHEKSTTPLDAIKNLFEVGALLDCERMADACVYAGIAAAFELNGRVDEFNQIFEGKGIELRHIDWKRLDGFKVPMKVVDCDSSPLLPGDRVYFRNLPDYLDLNRNGRASGEHAIYVGNGKFQALKLQPISRKEMLEYLAVNYDFHQAAFCNYLYEVFEQKDNFKPWNQIFPGVIDSKIQKFKEQCHQDLSRFKVSNNKFVSDKNIEELCDLRFEAMVERVEDLNKSMFQSVLRVDVVALMKLIDKPKISVNFRK